jgi:hypothetical protein
MPILSAKDYAAHRGVSAQAVSKAIKSGRLARSLVWAGGKKPRIDSDLADAEWSSNSDPSKVRAGAAAADSSAKIGDTPTRASGLPLAVNASAMAADGTIDYQKARSSREYYLAETARLEFEEKLGLLVAADEAGARWLEIAALVRAKVMAIASQAKARCPDLTHEEVEAIEGLARDALEDLAGRQDAPAAQEVNHA